MKYMSTFGTSLPLLAHKVSNKKQSHSNSISVFGICIRFSFSSTRTYTFTYLQMNTTVCIVILFFVFFFFLIFVGVIAFELTINFSLYSGNTQHSNTKCRTNNRNFTRISRQINKRRTKGTAHFRSSIAPF